MLVLPIVNRNRVLNVEVKLKNARKIRSGIKFADAGESEIIVNGKRLSDSSFKNTRTDRAAVDFIRNTSVKFRRNFLITTREESSSTFYDVYEVEQPMERVNDGLENLYVSVITDMRKEIPRHNRGRYLSLKKLGVADNVTDEKIRMLQDIVSNIKDSSQWPILFERVGIMDLVLTLDFIKQFDFTVIDDTTISEEALHEIISSLEKINTRDSRNLSSYYSMALSNRDVYTKLSTVNKILYDKPLVLIQSKRQKEKQLVKSMGENNELVA